jgi:hypothetical protein
MAKPATLQVNESALLAAITRSKGYETALHKRAVERQAELQQVASAFYQGALNAASQVFQEGATGADSGRVRLKAAGPYGKNVQANVAWKPLSKRWRKEKARRAAANYEGADKSLGPHLFWLDTGLLRATFAGWIPGKGKATVGKPNIRTLAKGKTQVTYAIGFKKLPIGFLDTALRRALIEGAHAGRDATLVPMHRAKRKEGLYRAFWAEELRPTMRPLAMRLGRAMQEQILKILRRR